MNGPLAGQGSDIRSEGPSEITTVAKSAVSSANDTVTFSDGFVSIRSDLIDLKRRITIRTKAMNPKKGPNFPYRLSTPMVSDRSKIRDQSTLFLLGAKTPSTSLEVPLKKRISETLTPPEGQTFFCVVDTAKKPRMAATGKRTISKAVNRLNACCLNAVMPSTKLIVVTNSRAITAKKRNA
ncbi:MAG: hypothetical protein HN683_04505 [Gammaproteobacteria bacterium]|nr:hypothetical protein [Gammaproteobacteria bacterium]